MAIGIFQPLNALIRPHPDGNTCLRLVWELVHKSIGFLVTLAGLLNCAAGAALARTQEVDEPIFDHLFLASLGMGTMFILAYGIGKVRACCKTGGMQEEPPRGSPPVLLGRGADLEASTERAGSLKRRDHTAVDAVARDAVSTYLETVASHRDKVQRNGNQAA